MEDVVGSDGVGDKYRTPADPQEVLAVLRAEMAERDRIAAELHDLVIQRLFASGIALQSAISLAPLPEEVSGRVERVIDDLDATIAEVRSAIVALGQRSRPPS